MPKACVAQSLTSQHDQPFCTYFVIIFTSCQQNLLESLAQRQLNHDKTDRTSKHSKSKLQRHLLTLLILLQRSKSILQKKKISWNKDFKNFEEITKKTKLAEITVIIEVLTYYHTTLLINFLKLVLPKLQSNSHVCWAVSREGLVKLMVHVLSWSTSNGFPIAL